MKNLTSIPCLSPYIYIFYLVAVFGLSTIKKISSESAMAFNGTLQSFTVTFSYSQSYGNSDMGMTELLAISPI